VVGTLIRLWPTGPVHFRGAVTGPGPVHTDPAVTEAGLTAGAVARFSSELEWVLSDPTLGQRLIAAAPAVLVLAAGLGIAWSLWHLLTAAGRAEPFTRLTVRYARLLAGLVLALAVARPFVQMASQFFLIAQVSADPQVLFSVELSDFLPLLAGVLLVVLTEVYARGLALRDDTDGLV
jgi:hypothetical protein